MRKQNLTILAMASMLFIQASAQTDQLSVSTASSSMTFAEKAPIVSFNISDEGREMPVRWGIDTAWLWDWWPLRATNHMQECVSVGRVTVDPRVSGSYTALAKDQSDRLDLQLSWLAKSGVKDLLLLAGNASGQGWNTSFRTSFVNDIYLAVDYLLRKGYNVIAVSPFNEPDYGANNAPDAAEMATVARLIRQVPSLSDMDIAGPSCLNPDYAYSWWNTMKDAVQIGNTHQLAGSYDSFAGFYQRVTADGKKSAGDEMHNINDALIGMNYGMTLGVWWSDYGGYTRAELGRATGDGRMIGYKENRATWTSAAVFRRESQQLAEAFIGSSERQAADSWYTFFSQDRLVYHDGEGPCYEYSKFIPGGTGYGTGQTNAECVVEMTYGEDVPAGPLNGNFKLVNKATGHVLSTSGGGTSNGTRVVQAADGKVKNQAWTITPVSPAGDYSYSFIVNTATVDAASPMYLDAPKYQASNGTLVQLYGSGGNECERWHLRYMGDGYYVITNADTGLSLDGNTDTNVVQWARTGNDSQLWKIIPAEAQMDNVAPAAPTSLQAQGLSGSVELTWEANSEADILGYMIYRYNNQAKLWETIARQVESTRFVDNTCPKGVNQQYRVRAIDKAWNLSEPSASITAATSAEKWLMARLPLNGDMKDKTENAMDAVGNGGEYTGDLSQPGIRLNGTDQFLSLPYNMGNARELTFSAWVRGGSNEEWQRVFDFGRNTDNYLFLTAPRNGTIRFEICKDGDKQGFNSTSRLVISKWYHVAVTISNEAIKLYINGEEDASSTSITYRPSDINPLVSYVGRSFFDNDPLMKGTIGDLRLYNYPLSAAEVKALYHAHYADQAADMLSEPMYKEHKQELEEAVNSFNSQVEDPAVTDAQVTLAVNALAAAMRTAQTAINAYKPLGKALQRARTLADSYPQKRQTAIDAFEQQYEEVMNDYLAGEYSDEQVADVAEQVYAFSNNYQMTDAKLVATRLRPVEITHLMTNADFSDAITEGWTLTTNQATYKGDLAFGCFEVFNHTFTLSQSMPGMPAGTYKLDVVAFYRDGEAANAATATEANALLFVDDQTAPLRLITAGANAASGAGNWYEYATNKKIPNDMEAAAHAFNKLNRYTPLSGQNTLTMEFDGEGELTVGMKKTKAVANDWTIVNTFRLYYLGAPKTDAIEGMTDDSQNNENDATYDLQGRQVDSSTKGVLIQSGKKVFNK